jgi:membrane-associated phospholipid phosphatase
MCRSLAALCFALALSAPANADTLEASPLDEEHSATYYGVHAGLTGAGFLGVLTLNLAIRNVHPGSDFSFSPDEPVRLNFSPTADTLSDGLLIPVLATPVTVQVAQGLDTISLNATLIYAETHAANQLIGTLTKFGVRRPRPYTHSRDPRVRAFATQAGDEAYLSFFSAHSSSAHTAAMAGSLLYAMRSDELVSRHVLWGTEFALAGLTAGLRVRAGRHYRSDVWTGALVGSAIGLSVPALHGADLSRVRWSEWVTAGSLMAGGYLVTELVDFCALTDGSGLCLPSWTLLPQGFESGAGLAIVGGF